MKTSRQLNTEDRSGYFFSDMTNINDFDPSLLSIDEVVLRDDKLIMYDISYAKNVNRQNALYLVFNNLDGIFQRSGGNKYLIFSSTEKSRIILENYTELFNEIAEQIELMTDDKVKYCKDTLKIKFKTSDDLPFDETINILVCVCVIIVSCIFQENNEYHPQISLYDFFLWV